MYAYAYIVHFEPTRGFGEPFMDPSHAVVLHIYIYIYICIYIYIYIERERERERWR